jgi:hypothetical protein
MEAFRFAATADAECAWVLWVRLEDWVRNDIESLTWGSGAAQARQGAWRAGDGDPPRMSDQLRAAPALLAQTAADHHHKESMAYLGAASYTGAAAAFVFSGPQLTESGASTMNPPCSAAIRSRRTAKEPFPPVP